ncbi:MAG: flagellar basal body rod protein FlgB [Phycisphaerales bacterium]
MISGVTDAGSLPVLERMMQFAGARQRLLADAVANFNTPGYRAQDVSVEDFQSSLAEAADERRIRHRGRAGTLELEGSDQVRVRPEGLRLEPGEANENILFHDGNDRDLERTMQAVVENVMSFRSAISLMRTQYDQLLSAVRERP